MAIDQQELIQDLLEEDRFMMIVLDACRYDYLSKLVDERDLNLDVKKVKSPANNTPTWIRTVWPGEYDIIYISPVSWISNEKVSGYDASEHFKNVVEAWRMPHAEDRLLTPEDMVRSALGNADDRMIIHFSSPHMPHTGEPSLLFDDVKGNNLTQIGENGDVSDAHIRNSYFAELERTWDEGVTTLVESLRSDNDMRRIVVTADHGEALGENDNYGHNISVPEVTTIPWIEM